VPFVTDGPTIKKLAGAIPRPINILAQPDTPSLKELQAMGVARVTVGGNISRAAYQAAKQAAEELKAHGTFGFAKGAITHPELNKLLS
jgi:2-methylisocitrate lyase-like PEP mutase family enzyme